MIPERDKIQKFRLIGFRIRVLYAAGCYVLESTATHARTAIPALANGALFNLIRMYPHAKPYL